MASPSERRNEYVLHHDTPHWRTILAGEVVEGMTRAEAVASVGPPASSGRVRHVECEGTTHLLDLEPYDPTRRRMVLLWIQDGVVIRVVSDGWYR